MTPMYIVLMMINEFGGMRMRAMSLSHRYFAIMLPPKEIGAAPPVSLLRFQGRQGTASFSLITGS